LSNPFVLWGIVAELALLASIVYTPLGNLILGTGPLPWWAWGPLVLGAAALLLAEEIRKIVIHLLPRPLPWRESPRGERPG
jgi:sodium/potassium-transporting ATPase subunit alpha